MFNPSEDLTASMRRHTQYFFVAYLLLTAGFALMMVFKPSFLGLHPEFPFLLITGFGLIIYNYYFRKLKLSYFGIENIQLIGAKMSAQWRDEVWEKGKLTIAQWDKAKRVANL